MKYKKIIPSLILLLSIVSNAFAQNITIVTSQGTHVLTPPEKCINSTCLNGLVRIAEIAGTALAADIATANNDAKRLDGEIKTASTAYAAAKNDYQAGKIPYDAKLGVYTADLKVHNSAADANNAKKPEDRVQAEVDRINRNKAALDVRMYDLNKDYDVLIKKWVCQEACQGHFSLIAKMYRVDR